eukprot:204765_1
MVVAKNVILCFYGQKKKEAIDTLDDIHFLYVVSLILKRDEFNNVESKSILQYLHGIKMNGLMFNTIDKQLFTQSVVCDANLCQTIYLDKVEELRQCMEKLWDEISAFHLSSIQPSVICNIPLQASSKNDEEKNQVKRKYLSIFAEWMITFNSQYNRNIKFGVGHFDKLLKTYEND